MFNAQIVREHFLEEGTFNPFAYAIGLESSVADSLNSLQHYPIPQPVSDSTMQQFVRSLTYIHEATHLCQYVSSAMGLRTLRFTNILLSRLSRKRGWQLPIAQNLFDRIASLNREEELCYEACLLFLDAMDQLKLHHSTGSVNPRSEPSHFEIQFLSWSPHLFVQVPGGVEQHVQELRRVGAHIKRLPKMVIFHPGGSSQLILNTASLMESYAILSELNHIHNALDISWSEAYSLLPNGNEYHALPAYLVSHGLSDLEHVIPTLCVCIDAAMMYDPFILYDVPWDVHDEKGKHDQYSGETFLQICDALKTIGPLASNRDEDVSRYYKQICFEAGLPDPAWMASKTHEIANTLLGRTPWQKSFLGKPLKAHADALAFRCELGLHFPLRLVTSEALSNILNLAKPATSFFNIHTRKADNFDCRKIDGLSAHSILLQALSQRRIECPLKAGDPFLCDSADEAPSALCTWKHSNGTNEECLLDILEQQFGFKSS